MNVSLLAEAMRENSTLTTLNLRFNNIPPTSKHLLRSAWNNRSPELYL